MANLVEVSQWDVGIYQLETSDPVMGGANGVDNVQAKQLANRTTWLKAQISTLNDGKQTKDATLTALSGVVVSADKMLYATGADTFAVTPLTSFIRTLLDDTTAQAARSTLGAAPIDSPTFTGTPAAATAADGTNTTQVATTAFVQSAVGGYLSKAVTGGTVTLTELESSNPVIALTGTLTSNLTVILPTTVKRLWAVYNATAGAFTVTMKLVTGTGVAVAQGKRNLVYTDGVNVYDGFNDFESVALTGTPTTPTATADTVTTQIASTAFVLGQLATTAPATDGVAAVGVSKKFSRADHVHPTDTSRAPIASPTFTGLPAAPTAADGVNTTQVATTAFVQSAVGGYLSKTVTGGTVTLTELESSNPVIALTGTLISNLTVILPTTVKRLWAVYNATAGAFTVTMKLVTGTGVAVAQGKRNLVYTDGVNVYDGFNDFESVALTGTPTTPTATEDTATTQIANTAFVLGQIATTAPAMDGTVAVGVSKKFARADHVHPTDASRAPTVSPIFTGTPTAPTAAVATNNNQIASTAFVQSAVSSVLLGQQNTTFTTTGTAPTFVGVMTPVPTALASGLRGRVKFHAATSAAATLDLNTLGAKAIKQYDSAGAKVAATIYAGMLTDLEYDGTDWVVLDNMVLDKKSFPSSLTANGYKKYPDPNSPTGFFIEQWGTTTFQTAAFLTTEAGPFGTVAAGTITATSSITFPIAFSTAVLACGAIGGSSNEGAEHVFNRLATTVNSISFRAVRISGTNAGAEVGDLFWWAKGF